MANQNALIQSEVKQNNRHVLNLLDAKTLFFTNHLEDNPERCKEVDDSITAAIKKLLE